MTGGAENSRAGRKARLFAILAVACFTAHPATARDILLSPPLACDLATTCFVQNHFDHDPGPGAADFTCAPQSYDGHDGTDFALPDLAMMVAGVDVLAAAPGTVKAVRDGEPDALQGIPGAPDVSDKECGNGVVIDHGGGWETQYCHMKQGSVVVTPGLRVRKGQPIGQVGLSGQTEFPHVHLSVRHDGAEVDPFYPDTIQLCGGTPDHTLWQEPLPYQPGGIINAGFATEVPSFEAIKAGLGAPSVLPVTAPALVLWVHLFGSRPGDRVHLVITGPEGSLLNTTEPLDRAQARLFRAAGKRLVRPAWPAGTYSGTATLLRGADTIDSQTVALTLGP